MITLTPPPPALTESAALRTVGLAASRRPWLRARLPHIVCGGQIIYDLGQVEALRVALVGVNLTNRKTPINHQPIQLQTR